jgi:hypothetical protein
MGALRAAGIMWMRSLMEGEGAAGIMWMRSCGLMRAASPAGSAEIGCNPEPSSATSDAKPAAAARGGSDAEHYA